jgi:hypothetical protein
MDDDGGVSDDHNECMLPCVLLGGGPKKSAESLAGTEASVLLGVTLRSDKLS